MNVKSVVIAAVAAICLAATPCVGKPTKVGIFASLYTATGPSWWRTPVGFRQHMHIANGFRDRDYEVYAIVDPGTEKDPQLLAAMVEYGFDAGVVTSTDVDALSALDVMLSGRWHLNIHWETFDAITEAVRRGTGLVNITHIGLVRPAFATGRQATLATWASHMNPDIVANPDETERYKEQMQVLFGIEDAQFVWHVPGLTWRVTQSHPLLGELLKEGDVLTVPGVHGLVGTSPTVNLLQSTADIVDNWNARTIKRHELNPFTVHRLGRGTTINCGLSSSFEGSKLARGGPDLHRRCVDWLTEQRRLDRPVEEDPELLAAAEVMRQAQYSLLDKDATIDEILALMDVDTLAAIHGASLSEVEAMIREKVEARRQSATEEETDSLIEAEIVWMCKNTSFARKVKEAKGVAIEGKILSVRLTDDARRRHYLHNVGGQWLLLDWAETTAGGFFEITEGPTPVLSR